MISTVNTILKHQLLLKKRIQKYMINKESYFLKLSATKTQKEMHKICTEYVSNRSFYIFLTLWYVLLIF